jgi:hypothetical protein
MNETKPAVASSSVWGIMLVGLSTALSLSGVKIDGLDDPQLALDISTLIGAALALSGRLRPMIKPISGWFVAK